jgi:hypothetical protein
MHTRQRRLCSKNVRKPALDHGLAAESKHRASPTASLTVLRDGRRCVEIAGSGELSHSRGGVCPMRADQRVLRSAVDARVSAYPRAPAPVECPVLHRLGAQRCPRLSRPRRLSGLDLFPESAPPQNRWSGGRTALLFYARPLEIWSSASVHVGRIRGAAVCATPRWYRRGNVR